MNSLDQPIILLVNLLQTTVKTKDEELPLVGMVEATEMKGLQPLFFYKGQMQFNPIIWLGGGRGYLGNHLHFRGKEQERAIQQNSCTL